MTHFGIFGHPEINIGGILEGTSGPAEPTALQTFLSGDIFTLQSSEPTVTTDLFDKFLTSISSVFTAATQERIELGEASVDISFALSEQIAIREQQRVIDQEQVAKQALEIQQINDRLSTQITELGQSASSFDPIKFFTDNPLVGGIGVGGLLVGGVVLLLLIRR